MGKESYDLFLVLTRADGGEIKGESQDAHMAVDRATNKPCFPIEINDFGFSLDKPADDAKAAAPDGELDDNPLAALEAVLEATKGSAKKLRRQHTFSIKKDVDTATTGLFKAYCENLSNIASGAGESSDSRSPVEKFWIFSKAVLSVRKAGGDPSQAYLHYEFEQLNVEHMSFTISETDYEENIHFTFDKVKVTYKPQADTGELVSTAGPADASGNSPMTASIDFTKDEVLKKE